MRVLVCGGRDFDHKDIVFGFLDKIDETTEITDIIHGGAKGADMLAHEWAHQHQRRMWVYPADWDKYGWSAGPIRNQKMIDEGKPDLIVAFPGGRGTADMVNRARTAGIKVAEIKWEEENGC